MSAPVLAAIAPCFNEQEVLPETLRRLSDILSRLVYVGTIHADSRVWLVDDGSRGTPPGDRSC